MNKDKRASSVSHPMKQQKNNEVYQVKELNLNFMTLSFLCLLTYYLFRVGAYALARKYVDKTSEGSALNWAVNVLVRGGKKMELSDYVTWAGFCAFLYLV